MPSIFETLGPNPQFGQESTPLHDALAAGTAVLSGDQLVNFTPYVRTVLPADGWVFWINAALLSPTQLGLIGLQSPNPVAVQGSLHYASVGIQDEDQNIVITKVDLSALSPVDALGAAAPTVLWVGTWTTDIPAGSFRFTFSNRNAYYDQAGISHFVGDAVYPVFEAQLIDSLDNFDQSRIVSNSLPIWMAICRMVPFPSLVTVNFPIYPSFLVPDNCPPPYAAIMIPPSSTRSLQSAPWLDRQGNHWQLMRERVEFRLFGFRNKDAIDLQDYLIQYSLVTEPLFGFAEFGPVIRDEHRSQVELVTLALHKVLSFDVNYYQHLARDLARQLINAAPYTFEINPVPAAVYPKPPPGYPPGYPPPGYPTYPPDPPPPGGPPPQGQVTAVQFSGSKGISTNTYLSTTNLATLTASNKFFAAGWIGDVGGGMTFGELVLFGGYEAGLPFGIYVGNYADAIFNAYGFDGAGNPIFVLTSNVVGDLSVGWHSFAVNIDTAAQTIQLLIDETPYYYNSSSFEVVWSSSNPIAFSPTGPWVVGQSLDANGIQMSVLWAASGFGLDLSNTLNQEILFGSSNCVQNWTSTLGPAPVFLIGAASAFASNTEGTGGPFTVIHGPLVNVTGPTACP